MIGENVKALDFNTITTMAMEDDEDAKSKEHAHNRILESEMKTNYKKRNKKVSQLNVHII